MKTDSGLQKNFSPSEQRKKETILQVYIPIGVAVILFLVMAVLAGLSATPGSSNVHHWSNIAFMLLAIPAFILLLIGLIIAVLLIVGQSKLLRWLPIQIRKVYVYFLKASLWIWQSFEKLTSPVISAKSKSAGYKSIFKKHNK
jgi:predicted neutral ceramidase superfamily lipid hydrolase